MDDVTDGEAALFWYIMAQEYLRRAETAEKKLDDLRARVQGEDGLNARAFKIMQLKMQIGQLDNENGDLRARVAQLEAQLAE